MPVNWEAISAIGQLVGALAVVISLIYLASEVRRNTRAKQLRCDALDVRRLQSVGSTTRTASAFN